MECPYCGEEMEHGEMDYLVGAIYLPCLVCPKCDHVEYPTFGGYMPRMNDYQVTKEALCE